MAEYPAAAQDRRWRVRGCADELTGATSLRRGRRDAHDVVVGDAIDFWRVIAVDPGRRLTLLAEMKLPAALEIEVRPENPERTRVVVTGYYRNPGANP